jgi:selenide,water dikinase
VGTNTADDAGVFRLSDDLALIQTVDFFTPVVDDPYVYGQISAANSLSDIYAMGGKPITCLNIVGFPTKYFSHDVLMKIMNGGFSKIEEAGAVLAGGHTILDDELKYGLSVTGIVHPQRIIRNVGAHPGDQLILTKPIGTGIISTAIKQGKAAPSDIDAAVDVMLKLNNISSECMQEIGVHAATDISGFGILGHAFEMAKASQVSIEIAASKVSIIPPTFKYFEQGCIPGGTANNQLFLKDKIQYDSSLPEDITIILNDAQTSGGLLMSVPSQKSDSLLQLLHQKGISDAKVVGQVVPKGRYPITVHP